MAKENNTKKNKNNRKENIVSKEESVEVVKKDRKETASKIFNTVENNRRTIITGVVCFLLATLLFRCILWPDRIATLKDGTQPVFTINDKVITANDLYDDMRESYSADSLVRKIDQVVLDELYSDDDVMEAAKSTAQYYYSLYESYYGMSKENFLSQNGFASENAFIEYLLPDEKRTKYFDDTVVASITDSEIEKYYKNSVTGDIDTKHILVSVSSSGEDGLSDSDAKKLAEEMIKKLNKGTSWEDVIKEYKDQIVDEELGYQSFNASLDAAYLKEMKALKVGTYSKKPIKSSYGYHIVYKIDEKEKPALEDVKDSIVDAIATEKKSSDEKLKNKILKEMREKYNLSFSDTTYEDKYKTYLKSN